MSARLIDGKRIALETRLAAGRAAAELLARTGIVPGLATVLVGEDPASAVYVGSKERACKELGIASFGFRLPASASQAELEAQVDALNARPDVHGILVQMPLPEHLDSDAIIDRIHPRKDVDGFNTLNVGLLAQPGDVLLLSPALPGFFHLHYVNAGREEGFRAILRRLTAGRGPAPAAPDPGAPVHAQ